MSFKFDIVDIPGRENKGPDAASRNPEGPPERLILPGEPPETDIGQSMYVRGRLATGSLTPSPQWRR